MSECRVCFYGVERCVHLGGWVLRLHPVSGFGGSWYVCRIPDDGRDCWQGVVFEGDEAEARAAFDRYADAILLESVPLP